MCYYVLMMTPHTTELTELHRYLLLNCNIFICGNLIIFNTRQVVQNVAECKRVVEQGGLVGAKGTDFGSHANIAYIVALS